MRFRLRTLLIVLAIAPPVLWLLARAAVWLANEPMLLFEIGVLLSPLMCLAPFAAAFIVFYVATRIAARRKPN